MKTWKVICEQEAKHPKREISPDTEVVIKVDPEIHSKILEIQAQHFRKTEKKQLKALQALVFVEMKNAVLDQMAKRVIEKQNNMEEIKRRQRREHELAVEQKHRQEREELEEKDREYQKEMKIAQKEYLEAVKAKSDLEKENLRREKQQQVHFFPFSSLLHHSSNVKQKDYNERNIIVSKKKITLGELRGSRLKEDNSCK